MAPSDHIFIELASDELLNDGPKPEPKVPDDLAATMSDEQYSSMLGTLCDEAHFLVDEETRESLPNLVPAHQDWVQCVSILHALGIKNGAGLEKLRIALRGIWTLKNCSICAHLYPYHIPYQKQSVLNNSYVHCNNHKLYHSYKIVKTILHYVIGRINSKRNIRPL